MIERILAELEKQFDSLSTTVTLGRVTDWADYRFLTGQIRGLVYCSELIKETVKQLEEEEDRRE